MRGFRPQDPVTCSGQKDLRLIPLGGRERPWSIVAMTSASHAEGRQLDLAGRIQQSSPMQALVVMGGVFDFLLANCDAPPRMEH